MSRMKIGMAIHESDIQPVAAELARFENLHFETPGDRDESDWHDLAERLSDQKQRLQNLIEKLEISGELPKKPFPDTTVERIADDADQVLERLEPEFDDLEAERKRIDDRLDRLRALSKNRHRLEAAGIDFDRLQTLSFLHLEFGTIPIDQRDRITFPVIRTPVVIVPLFASGNKLMVAAVTLQKNAFVLNTVLGSLFYEPLEGMEATDEAFQDPERQITDLENRRKKNEQGWKRLAEGGADRLLEMQNQIQSVLAAVRIISQYGRPGKMVVFTGEAAENDIDRLFDAIKNKAQQPHTLLAGKPWEAD